MKKIFAAVVCVIAILSACICFAGCNQEDIKLTGDVLSVNCKTTATKTGFSSEHDLLRGERQYTINIKEKTTMNVKVESKDGSISAKMTDKDGNVIFEKTDIETESFSFEIPAKGRYTVDITAEDHEGSYSFSLAS